MGYSKTNFKRLKPFLEAVRDSEEGYLKFESKGYMPLSIEKLWYDYKGTPVYSIAHYGEQNGDLMADPEMEIAVNFEAGEITPLTYRQDYMGFYQDIRDTPSERLKNQLDDFLRMWTGNIIEQRFTVNNIIVRA